MWTPTSSTCWWTVCAIIKKFLGNATELATDYFKNRPDLPKYEANKQNSDIYIHPNLTGYDALSFGASNVHKMSEIGQNAAALKLKVVK